MLGAGVDVDLDFSNFLRVVQENSNDGNVRYLVKDNDGCGIQLFAKNKTSDPLKRSKIEVTFRINAQETEGYDTAIWLPKVMRVFPKVDGKAGKIDCITYLKTANEDESQFNRWWWNPAVGLDSWANNCHFIDSHGDDYRKYTS